MSGSILPDIPVSAIDSSEEQYNAVVDLRAKMEELLHEILATTSITDINNTAATISGTYVQAEVQQIATDTETVSDKVDTMLTALRSAGILGE